MLQHNAVGKHQRENYSVYRQTEIHSNVNKKQEVKGIGMEQTAVQSMQYKSKVNPKVKVTLEFTGIEKGLVMEDEIINVLEKKYLEKVLSETRQGDDKALLYSTRKKEENANE